MIGIKLAASRRADDPLLDPICRLAAERGVPVLHHIWQHRRREYPGRKPPTRVELGDLARAASAGALPAGAHRRRRRLAALAARRARTCPTSTSTSPAAASTAACSRPASPPSASERLLWGCDLTIETGWAKLRYLEHLLPPPTSSWSRGATPRASSPRRVSGRLMRIDVNAFVGAYPFRRVPGTSPEALLAGDGPGRDRRGVGDASARHLLARSARRQRLAARARRGASRGCGRCRRCIRSSRHGKKIAASAPRGRRARGARRSDLLRHRPAGPRDARARRAPAATRACRSRWRYGSRTAASAIRTTARPSCRRRRCGRSFAAIPGVRLLVTHADRPFVEEVHFGSTPEEAARIWWDICWIWGPPEDHLETLLATVGAERFVFGTGQPLRIPENAVAKLDLLDLAVARGIERGTRDRVGQRRAPALVSAVTGLESHAATAPSAAGARAGSVAGAGVPVPFRGPTLDARSGADTPPGWRRSRSPASRSGRIPGAARISRPSSGSWCSRRGARRCPTGRSSPARATSRMAIQARARHGADALLAFPDARTTRSAITADWPRAAGRSRSTCTRRPAASRTTTPRCDAILELPGVLGIKVATLDSVMTFQRIAALMRAPPRQAAHHRRGPLPRLLAHARRARRAGRHGRRAARSAGRPAPRAAPTADWRARSRALGALCDRFAQATFIEPMEGYMRRMLWAAAADGALPAEACDDPWGPALAGEERAAGRARRCAMRARAGA